jgi:hypothetical protein
MHTTSSVHVPRCIGCLPTPCESPFHTTVCQKAHSVRRTTSSLDDTLTGLTTTRTSPQAFVMTTKTSTTIMAPCAVLQQRSSLCLIVMELDGLGYLSLDDLSGLIHDTEMDIWFKFILTSSRLEFLDSLKLVGDRSLTGLG